MIRVRPERVARTRQEFGDRQNAVRTDQSGHLHAERGEGDQIGDTEQTQEEPPRKDERHSHSMRHDGERGRHPSGPGPWRYEHCGRVAAIGLAPRPQRSDLRQRRQRLALWTVN